MKSLFILILTIILLGGIYFGFVYLKKEIISSRAITMSENYIKELYSEYKIVGKICQGEDTDADSYVSCDLRIINDKDNLERVVNLQCPTLWKSFTGSTCKERFNVPGMN